MSAPAAITLGGGAAPAGVSLSIWFCSPTSERASRNRMEPMAVRACMLILREDGLAIGRHRTARLMRDNALKGNQKRRFKKTTDSNHAGPVAARLPSNAIRI